MFTDNGGLRSPGELIKARGEQAVEALARESENWKFDQFVKILATCSAFDIYPSASHRPESIDLSRLSRHANELVALSRANGGVETGRVFLSDFSNLKLIQGKTTIGTSHDVYVSGTRAPGREATQRGTILLHTHPESPQDKRMGYKAFSPLDFEALLTMRETIAIMAVMGESHLLMAMKTSATAREFDQKKVKDLVTDVFGDRFNPATGAWTGTPQDAIRANKDVCLTTGLMYYLGKVSDGKMTRMPLSK